jgi:aspartyl-tRNA(Asn)/glutamyl-tRNA(Gln) amidotransferase subunit A
VDAAARHAVVVERLLAAGCAIVGKTHTVELAYGGYGTNRAVGAPCNPWRLEPHHAPGGSSSGSAVAVAAGLCDAALGTDTGGSVRIPAALCGVVGLKPGRGLVSREGVHPLSFSLDTVGVLASDVATAARLLAAMAGGAPDAPRAFDAEAALTTGRAGRTGRGGSARAAAGPAPGESPACTPKRSTSLRRRGSTFASSGRTRRGRRSSSRPPC